MNIFYTSISPIESAGNLCKIHVNKMYQESCQLLSTALQLRGIQDDRLPEITHYNHPCAVWVRVSIHHYNWLLYHTLELRRLFGKEHGYDEYFEVIQLYTPNILDNGFWDPPACVDKDILSDDRFITVEDCYKEYLIRKYNNWQTRTDKRRMPVKFYNDRNFYHEYQKSPPWESSITW